MSDYVIEVEDKISVPFYGSTDELERVLAVVDGDQFPQDRDLPDTGASIALVFGKRVVRGRVLGISYVIGELA